MRWCCLWTTPRFVLQERFSVCLDQVTSAIGICVGLRLCPPQELWLEPWFTEKLVSQAVSKTLPSESSRFKKGVVFYRLVQRRSMTIDAWCVCVCVCVTVLQCALTWVSGLLSWTVLIYEAIAAIWLFGRLEDFSGFQLNSAHRTAVLQVHWCPMVPHCQNAGSQGKSMGTWRTWLSMLVGQHSVWGARAHALSF